MPATDPLAPAAQNALRRVPGRSMHAAVTLLALSLTACGGGGGGVGSSASSTSPSTGSSAPSAAPTAAPAPSPAPAPASIQTTALSAARLADQATFGSNDATVAAILAVGAPAWIDAQLATPATGYPVLAVPPQSSSVGCPSTAASNCYRDNYTVFPVQRVFLANAIAGKDQLRQRVAFALSQIFVVSGLEVGPAYAMREYQQLLLTDAFANYRTLLQDVTLSPTMGLYLNMVNNAKGNVALGTQANENYGREVMQLFSLGVNRLNADGSPVLDTTGTPVPTYSQTQVQGFAAAFTGWTYPAMPGATSKWHNPAYFIGQMVPFESYHDQTAKPLLNGEMTAAGQSAAADLKQALDSIANHPNVAPFIGKQLIQFLTTSNPSPAYVARISAVFNNDGTGVRGNLGAVVKAILLDPEAYGDNASSATFGKLREPAEFAVALARMLNVTSDGVALINPAANTGEPLFSAGSVFNFYPPSSPLPNSSLVAPQFGIVNTSTTLSRVALADNLIYGAAVAPDPTIPGAIGTQIDLSAFEPLAATPASLTARLNTLMVHGTLDSQEQNAIITAINTVSASDAIDRVRMAAYLVANSARFQITR